MPSFQHGFAPVVLILIISGVILGVYLVQNRTNFLPRASEEDELFDRSGVREIPKVPEFVANEVLVKVKDAELRSLDAVARFEGVSSFDPVSEYNSVSADGGRWYKVTFKGEGGRASGFFEKETGLFREPKGIQAGFENVIQKLKVLPGVVDIEPNYIRYLTAVPNDPYYAKHQWYLPRINMDSAWNVARGSGVLVAILDTGIADSSGSLPELGTESAPVGNPGERGMDAQGRPKYSNGVDDDGNGKVDDFWGWDFIADSNRVYDDMGHGTFVAGLIGANTNNGIGMAGVVGKPKMLAVKTCSLSGCEDGDIVESVEYSVRTGAKVLNMSFAGGYESSAVMDAMKYAWDRGAVLVASAGNGGNMGNPVMYPASYPNVLSVGAIDKNDNKTWFSSHGSWVSVTAPGEGLLSLAFDRYICEDFLLSDNGFCFSSGTSFSAPLVSGLAALVLSKHPSWTNQQVKQKIEYSARQIPGQESFWRFGRIDACRSLDCDAVSPPASPAPPGACPGGVNACGYRDTYPPSKCLNNDWRYVESSASAGINKWCMGETAGDPWGERGYCYECVALQCSSAGGQCADSKGKNRDKNLSCDTGSFREDLSYFAGGCDNKEGLYPYCYTTCEKVLTPLP